MNSQLTWKFVGIGIVILLCLVGIFAVNENGLTFPTSSAALKQNLSDRIKLGLDLKGGSHLVLQVQVEEAVGQKCDQAVDDLHKQIRDNKKIVVGEIRRVDDTHILVRDVDPGTSATFRDLINNQFTDWTIAPAAGEQNGYLLTMKPSVVSDFSKNTMDQSLEVITRRINALGLTEPTIAFTGRGTDEILVELPGEGDPTRAKGVIQASGQLQFNLVTDDQAYPSEVAALAAHGGVLPPGTIIVAGSSEASTSSTQQVYYILNRAPIITGQDLVGATPEASTTYPGQYDVKFTLSTAAAARFGPFTESNIGHKMAIILDNKVYTAPTIQGRIEDSGEITGNFSQQSAQDLSLVLRAGALPASIKYLEERTVGPSLGADSIRAGVRASLGSIIVVMIFLVIYYHLSGVNAVVALVLNLLILVAFMAYVGAVLTLPGIAGVILTIGMGVDSNVLVFERIREELRSGKAPAAAVSVGFDRAFLTIIDTHVTTVVSAIFLFLFGTGPVRGFAITLIIGLIANVFTSIYVSRAIFDFHLSHMDRQAELSI